MSPIKKSPQIFDYLELTGYLKDYYHYRKSLPAGFSYEKWALELELDISRIFLRMMALGMKRPSPKFSQAIAKNNFSTPREKQYFEILVLHSQAKSTAEKKQYTKQLIHLLRSETKYTQISELSEFLSNPTILRILVLTGFKDVQYTSHKIADLMALPIGQVETILSQLSELEMIERKDLDGLTYWFAHNAKYKISDQQGNINLLRFHEQSLKSAIEAFEQPLNLRKYRSLVLTLSPQELSDLYTHLEDFASEQFLRYSPDTYKGRQMFQMNFNIHPVTKLDSEATENSI